MQKISELIANEMIIGEVGKKELLIIVPFYSEFDILEKHLGFLANQSFQNFDVVIIPEKSSDEQKIHNMVTKQQYRFGLIIAKRKENTGSAGGFATGQIYAIENKYPYTINADADCYPIDKNLIQEFFNNRHHGYVSSMLYGTNNEVRILELEPHPSGISHYSLLSVALIKEIGLYYAPLFQGNEDVEYSARLGRNSFALKNCSETTLFGNGTIDKKFEKNFLFFLNNIYITNDPKQIVVNSIRLALTISGIALFFRNGLTLAEKLAKLSISNTYGKKLFETLRGTSNPYKFQAESFPSDATVIDFSQRTPKNTPTVFREIKSMFRKNIIIKDNVYGFRAILYAISAKRLAYWINDKEYLFISDNSSLIWHGVRMIELLFVFPIILVISIMLIPLHLIKRPRTHRYGLD